MDNRFGDELEMTMAAIQPAYHTYKAETAGDLARELGADFPTILPQARATLPEILDRVGRLYVRRRDPRLLEWLLDTTPGPGVGPEVLNQALFALWDTHSTEMLRAASSSDIRCRSVARALLYAIRILPDPCDWSRCLRSLRWVACCRDRPLRQAALQVLKLLAEQRPVSRRRLHRLQVRTEHQPRGRR